MKTKRVKNKKLIEEIRQQGCIIKKDCYGPVDVDHVTTRGAGGNDVVDNLMPLCRKHHSEKGWGIYKMIKKYPSYLKWLLKHERHDVINKATRFK